MDLLILYELTEKYHMHSEFSRTRMYVACITYNTHKRI